MNDNSTYKVSNPSDAERASKTWDVLASIGIAVTTNIPLPPSMIKSLRKSADRLITGSADYAMTFIEEATARRKAISDGKQKVLGRAADAVAEMVPKDNSLMERATATFANELMVKQSNREKVFALAANELKTVSTFDDSNNVIDDDWLGDFATLASNKSNAEVQQLLGKILAGEIRKPGTFSPLTLQVLSTLTPNIAKSFETYCNLCMVVEPGLREKLAFIAHKPYPEFLNTGLKEFGIGFGEFMVLQNYGLLAQRLDVGFSHTEPVLEVVIEVGGATLRLKSKIGKPINLILAPVAPLSIPGVELRSIIALSVPPLHLQKQIEYFNEVGFDVIQEK